MCLACDAVLFNWIFIIINNFYWSCMTKNIEIAFNRSNFPILTLYKSSCYFFDEIVIKA